MLSIRTVSDNVWIIVRTRVVEYFSSYTSTPEVMTPTFLKQKKKKKKKRTVNAL